MCHTILYRSNTCQCTWLTVAAPCKEGVGFFNKRISHFEPKKAIFCIGSYHGFNYVNAPPNSCPQCDFKGRYDANRTRIIKIEGLLEPRDPVIHVYHPSTQPATGYMVSTDPINKHLNPGLSTFSWHNAGYLNPANQFAQSAHLGYTNSPPPYTSYDPQAPLMFGAVWYKR